ncbi:MAG: hypothetical protein QM730_09860 [Anaerolineales bacterium]
MTAQFNDVFRYKGKDFAIAGISAGELFRPADFGLSPIPASTACWRGYVAVFAVSDSYLVLGTLSVNLQEEQAPTINGISPSVPTRGLKLFNNVYADLKYRIPYTGGLLLGHDFISELYVHMGFHPAWKYKEVFELTFENGRLVSELDRSDWAAQERQDFLALIRVDDPNRMLTKKEISDFVERSFDRTYKKDK